MLRRILLSAVATTLVTALMGTPAANAQPAPNLSYFQIRGVRSSAAPVAEYPADSAVITVNDHDGWLEVLTAELGYTTYTRVTINGYVGRQTESGRITNANGAIVGYWRVWRFDARIAGGWLTAEAMSINNGPRLSDGLRIR